jgi:hypothetical protein
MIIEDLVRRRGTNAHAEHQRAISCSCSTMARRGEAGENKRKSAQIVSWPLWWYYVSLFSVSYLPTNDTKTMVATAWQGVTRTGNWQRERATSGIDGPRAVQFLE